MTDYPTESGSEWEAVCRYEKPPPLPQEDDRVLRAELRRRLLEAKTNRHDES
jgi:hypothetical protein